MKLPLYIKIPIGLAFGALMGMLLPVPACYIAAGLAGLAIGLYL